MPIKMFFLIFGIFTILFSGDSSRCVRAFSWTPSSRLVEGSSSDLQCPSDYELHGSVCLKMSTRFSSHGTAETSCKESGGRLAAPTNEAIHSSIQQLAEKTKTAAYWIGLKKVNGRWTFSDGTPVGTYFVRWYPKQPIIGKDMDCGLMTKQLDHLWSASECKWGRRYVCQYDPIGLQPEMGPSETWTTDSVSTSMPTARPEFVKSGCDLGDLQNENLHPRVRPYPSTYHVSTVLVADCKEGFASRVPVTVECTKNNTWRIVEPCLKICSKPLLPSPLVPLNSSTASTFLEADAVLLACPIGLVLEGEGRVTCLPNGNWSTGPRGSTCATPKSIVDRPNKVSDNKIDDDDDDGTDCSAKDQRSDVAYNSFVAVDNEFLKLGQSVSLTCRQYARIEPRSIRSEMKEWTWMKEQDILDASTQRKYPHLKVDERGSLLILRMSRDLEGLYTCISTVEDDEHSRVSFRSVYVALTTDCKMALDVRPQDTVVWDGGYVVFRCYAHNATVTWFKGEVQLIEDDDHRVLPNGALLITNARPADTGTYRCTAQHVQTRCQVSHSASLEVESSVDALCGKPTTKSRTPSVENRGKIVGGEEVERGSHPWLALIAGDIPRPNRGRSSKVFCGGSLVNNYWVLTAAHCLRAIKQEEDVAHLKIMLGKHDRTNVEPDERVFRVLRAVVHPHFDEDSFDNDVAMLRLNERVYYSDYIIPVCLPPRNFMSQFLPLHRSAAAGFVVGWGQLTEAGLQPSELRAVQLPLISDELCRRSTSAIVTDNMFCAGYNLTTGDACKGDSGGPFEMSVDGRIYLAGIVSWGEGCARPAKYGFYAKVEIYVQDFVYKLWNE